MKTLCDFKIESTFCMSDEVCINSTFLPLFICAMHSSLYVTNLRFLNNVIINETKVPFPQA